MAPRMQRQSSVTTWNVPDSKFVHLMFAVMFTSTKISMSSESRPTKLQKKQMGLLHLLASTHRNPPKPGETDFSISCNATGHPLVSVLLCDFIIGKKQFKILKRCKIHQGRGFPHCIPTHQLPLSCSFAPMVSWTPIPGSSTTDSLGTRTLMRCRL